jgi:hypothetical protein
MYVVNAMTQWIAGWMLKKWKDVQNDDLFKRLQELACKRTMIWTHVKGHSGIHGNEMADKLAVAGCHIEEEKEEEKPKKTTKSKSKAKKEEEPVEEEEKPKKKTTKAKKEEEKVEEKEKPKKTTKTKKEEAKKEEEKVEEKEKEEPKKTTKTKKDTDNLSDLKEKLKSINKGAVASKDEKKSKMSANAVKKGKKEVDTYYFKTDDDSIIVSSPNKDEDLEFISEFFGGKQFELSPEKVSPTHRVAMPDARRKKKGIVKIPKRKVETEDNEDDE